MNNRFKAVAIACASTLSLSGCGTTAKYECDAKIKNGGQWEAGCRVTGSFGTNEVIYAEAFGEKAGGLLHTLFGQTMLGQTVQFNPATFNASLVQLSTAGSSAPIDGNSGQGILKLYKGTTLLGTTNVAWIRSGDALLAAQPAAVNSWVAQYPTADGAVYEVNVKFNPGTAPSMGISVQHSYNGTTMMSSSGHISKPINSGGESDNSTQQ